MIVKKFMKHFYLRIIRRVLIIPIITSLVVGLDYNTLLNLDEWNIIQDEPVKVDWIEHDGYPISRAIKILNYDIGSIANIIKDIEKYPFIFKRVTESKKLDSNIVHIKLDMPFPFASRDYVIQYNTIKEHEHWAFTFKAIHHPDGVLEPGVVRLSRAKGLWRLESVSDYKTLVTYVWNGELLGNFPKYGLTRAWKTQGTEVFNWLNEALYP